MTPAMDSQKSISAEIVLGISPQSLRTSPRGSFIGTALLSLSLISPALAQTAALPSEPLRLVPPKPIAPTAPVSGSWNQLPRDGLVIDPGASEAFDAADPSSPFRSNSGLRSSLGSKPFEGLPDVDPNRSPSTPSDLVSGSPLSELGDDDTDKPSRAVKQRLELRRRLEAAFPRDFLLDATDPGLFLLVDRDWTPVTNSSEKDGEQKDGEQKDG